MLFTILTAFFALLPTFGTAIVWVPITLFMIGNGFLTGNYGIVTRGIILAAYCFFFVSLIDNLIKPKIIGTKSGVHPVIIFIGILGGLKFFGITGIIIGPVVLAVLITLLNRFISQEQNN
jgi:predicted PurR-regulated permease PerM